MTQGELFADPPAPPRAMIDSPPPPAPTPAPPLAAAEPADEDHLHRRLRELGLWVDPETGRYIGRRLLAGEPEIEFIAADLRTGRSAFHTRPSADLRG